MPVMNCPVCSAEVPGGVFCGSCGAHLAPQPGDGPAWLRPRVFCAAPQEHVLRPAITSSLFPHLSQISRAPFAVGLVLIVVAMAVAVQLRLPAAMIAFATLGLPLLYLVYRFQTGVYHEVPMATLLLTVGMGVLAGVGFVLITDDLVIRATGSPFESGLAGSRVLRDGLGVAEGGVLAMIAPIVIVRLIRPGRLECLQGFVIGGIGALSFTAAATFTRLVPQLTAGPVSSGKPVQWLVVESAIRGLTVPITALCAGGLVGAALWFTRPADGIRLTRGAVLGLLAIFSALVLGNYGIVGAIDVADLPQLQILAWHVAMALVAVLSLRAGLQVALLHEASEPASYAPEVCLHCRNVVPDMAFCPSCGASAHTTSRALRTRQQQVTPLSEDEPGAPGRVWPGYSVPAERYTSAPLTRTPMVRVLGVWLACNVGVAAGLVGLSAAVSAPEVRFNCPPDCGHPPSGDPVTTNPRFTAADGGFTVAYPAPGSAYEITLADDGVTARYIGGDGGVLRLWSLPAEGRSAREVVTEVLARSYRNARRSYEIPNAMVGYQPGYGVVADLWPQDADARYTHLRVVLLAAVKNDLALIAGAIGPYRQFSPTIGPGRPSGANLELAMDMGHYVNSFSWRGDPPR
jgi:hypothetical protein